MIALVLAAALSQVPSPPTGWTRAEVEQRWGLPTFAGPLEAPWEPGAMVATYAQRRDDTDALCRVHTLTVEGARWMALVYYDAAAVLISVHCLQLGNLDEGHDVLPDVLRRLHGGRT